MRFDIPDDGHNGAFCILTVILIYETSCTLQDLSPNGWYAHWPCYIITTYKKHPVLMQPTARGLVYEYKFQNEPVTHTFCSPLMQTAIPMISLSLFLTLFQITTCKMDSEKRRTDASVRTLPIVLKEKINCFDLINIQMSSANRAVSTIC
jgi:hypothetical protein